MGSQGDRRESMHRSLGFGFSLYSNYAKESPKLLGILVFSRRDERTYGFGYIQPRYSMYR